MDSSFYIVWKIISGCFAFTWNLFAGIFHGIFRTSSLKRIEKENQKKRGVTIRRDPVPVSGMLSGLAPEGKLVVSGDDCDDPDEPSWRNVVAARAAWKAFSEGRGVVVLHTGNTDLVNRLASLIPESSLVISDPSNLCYDPLRDYDDLESVQVLMGSLESDRDSLESARTYLRGLYLAAEYCRKKKPSIYILQALAAQTQTKVHNQLQQCLSMGKITEDEFAEVTELLLEGVSGRSFLNSYLSQLIVQLKSIAVNKSGIPDSRMMNMRRAFERRMVLVLNVQTVTRHGMGYGLLLNECNAALAGFLKGYLVVDNLAVSDCRELLQAVSTGNAGLGICVTAKDLFARCASSTDKLNDVISGSQCCMVFRHKEGGSAAAWQSYFGTYKKTDISRNIADGKMRPNPFTLFPGRSSMEGNTQTEKEDFRVPAKEIQDLPKGAVYAVMSWMDGIQGCSLEDA